MNIFFLAAVSFLSCRQSGQEKPGGASGTSGDIFDRTILPIKEPVYPPITELDARNAKTPPRFEVKPPQGAPNIIIVLIDDIGFARSVCIGMTPKVFFFQGK